MCKLKRMSGYHATMIPGWDCHGLPIELKVIKNHQHNQRVETIQECRKFASQWVDVQVPIIVQSIYILRKRSL
jgi:isoleucyl-tRNA synthetase